MDSVAKAIEGLPFIVKLIFCIPVLDIIWSVYKICKSGAAKNVLGIILGVLCIVPGAFFIWIIDLVTLIVKGDRVWWLD